MARVLVACEFSGIVRDAFLARGHDAISCDLLPTERPGPHVQGDVQPLLDEKWDLVIAHPPCTYLCNSGVRWLHTQPGRWGRMKNAVQFYCRFFFADSRYVVAENPVMHGHARERVALPGKTRIQRVHPWQFGDPESKLTCLEISGALPDLVPTVTEKPDNVGHSVHRAPPGPDRWKERSRTFPGIADAMARDWGAVL